MLKGIDFWEGLFLLVLIGAIVVFAWSMLWAKSKQNSRFKISNKEVFMDDCIEAAKMMVNFIYDGIDEKRKHNECKDAGCDGYFTLLDSKDIASLVMISHKMGGRIVLRKIADNDIEKVDNTVLNVKKKLSELDISRAKRIDQKYRR